LGKEGNMNTQKYFIRGVGALALLTLLLSLIFPTTIVFADDTTPPSDTSEAVDTPVEEETPPEEEVSTETDAPEAGESVEGEPVAEDPATEEPTVDEVITAESAVEGSTSEQPAVQEPSVEEFVVDDLAPEEYTQEDGELVLSQLPDNTEVVVLGETGEVIPLATQEAADVVVAGDPMWCPAGSEPGDADCTASYTSMTDLLTYFHDNGQPTVGGTIYIANDYTSNNEPGGTTEVTIDGDEACGAGVSNQDCEWEQSALTIQGGWDFSTNSVNGESIFYIPFGILNWENTVTINNIFITGANGTGLTVTANDAVTVNEVTSSNNTGDGANLSTNIPGNPHVNDVTVNDSTFNDNGGNGLTIDTKGNAYLNKVTASGNQGDGVSLSMQTGQRESAFSCGIFTGNSGYGLTADLKSSDVLSLNSVYFSGNTQGDYPSTLSPTINSVDCAVLYCEGGQVWDPAQGGCVCPEGTSWNGDSCEEIILGCTDPTAFNYNPEANTDDGSCQAVVLGCTDSNANNYNSEANTDDGSCTYDVFGCTDQSANNYNELATIDDGSCTYDEVQDCPTGTSWNGEACEPIICPFGLVLDGDVCVLPEDPDETGGGTPLEESTFIPVTGACVPFSVEEKFIDEDLEILVILDNLCNYNISLDIVPEEIPVVIDHLSGLEVTLMMGDTIVTKLPPRTSVQLFFEIPEEMTAPEELAKHDFVVMYWDPFANNGEGEWVELETTVENGQAVVLLTPGTQIIFPATFALVDKNTIEEAFVPSTSSWINNLYVSLSQWFTSLAW